MSNDWKSIKTIPKITDQGKQHAIGKKEDAAPGKEKRKMKKRRGEAIEKSDREGKTYTTLTGKVTTKIFPAVVISF